MPREPNANACCWYCRSRRGHGQIVWKGEITGETNEAAEKLEERDYDGLCVSVDCGFTALRAPVGMIAVQSGDQDWELYSYDYGCTAVLGTIEIMDETVDETADEMTGETMDAAIDAAQTQRESEIESEITAGEYTIKEEVFTPEQLEQLEERGIHLTEQETQREYRVSVIEDPSAGRFVRQTILAWNGN